MRKQFYKRTTCLCGTGVLVLGIAVATPLAVLANPAGGNVVSGSAAITSSGSKMDIHQHTERVIIDWRGFDIDVGEHTQFHQPNTSSTALNRIKSPNPSKIAGALSANGNVILVNPNGVFFEGSSKIDVNGLIATTADIDNHRFMHGDMRFDKPGSPDATIVNLGEITAKDAGLVGLVAPSVENHGTINARLGRAHLASGDTFTVDMYGDGLFEVALSDDVQKQLVSNTGLIKAQGGVISMSAATGRNVVDSLISVEGELKAPTIEEKGGKIIIGDLGASRKAQGTVRVNGTVKTEGNHLGEGGGAITITAENVAIEGEALVSVSGKDDGGTVHIGGEFQGTGNTATAQRTYIGKNALIRANAEEGNGGEVIVWADDWTRFYGLAEARADAIAGHGGFAEISGKRYLDFAGNVDLLGAKFGTLLLDPDDIDIVAGSSNAGEIADDVINFADGGTAGSTTEIGADDLEVRLSANANVILQANNSIDVNATVTSTGSGDLTLQTGTGGTITVNNAIDVNTGDLTLEADEIDILANVATTGTLVLEEATSGRSIGVGSGSGSLDITNAELAFLSVGSIIFGGSNGTHGTSGDMTIDTTHDFGDSNVTFRSGGDIDFNATLDKASGAGTANWTFETDDEFDQNNSADITASSGAINLTINTDKDANNNGHITFSNATITTGGGSVVMGGGADPLTTAAVGVDTDGLFFTGSINTGAGHINLRGHSTGTDDQEHGVRLSPYTTGDGISTTSGNISIVGSSDVTATGAYGGNLVQNGGNALTIRTDSGDIDIDATGSANATTIGHGLRLNNGVNILSNSGDIEITAVAGGSSGLEISSTGSNQIGGGTHNGDITLILDDYNVGTTLSVQTTGTVTIEERTDGTSIGIGSTAAGDMSINFSELSNISASSIIFGGSNGTDGTSGNMEINSATQDFGDANVTFRSGGDIDLAGTLTKASGTGVVNYVFEADGNIINSNNADVVITDNNVAGLADDGTINLTLNADKDVDFDGAIALTGFSFTSNNGSFTAGGGADPLTNAAHGGQDGVHDHGVNLSGTDILTGTGAISIRGEGEDTNNANYGVLINTSSSLESTTGHIDIHGRGGNGGTHGYGITLNGLIESVDGNIALTGMGDGSSSQSVGIRMHEPTAHIKTVNGDVSLTGTAGASSSLNVGIELYNSATITSTGNGTAAGTITLNGTGGDGSQQNYGVELDGAGTLISSADGDIRITGTGASGATSNDNHGIIINNDADIASTDEANITLTGIVGAGTSAGIVTSGATVDIGESGGDNMLGDITLITDSLSFVDAALTTDGGIIIEEYTDTTSIDVGTAGMGILQVLDADLALMSAGSYTFGGGNTGALSFDSAYNFTGGNVSLTGETIDMQSNLDVGVNTLNLKATGGSITNSGAGTLTAGTLNLDATGTITADVAIATALDIGGNATGANLTGTLAGASNQAAANTITGGPGNSGNYRFESFIIRYTPPSGQTTAPPLDVEPPAPPVDPTIPTNSEPETDTTPEPEVVIPTSPRSPGNDDELPSTVEVVSQDPTRGRGFGPEAGISNPTNLNSFSSVRNNVYTGDSGSNNTPAGSSDRAKSAETAQFAYEEGNSNQHQSILSGLITLHPKIVEFFGLENKEI